MLEEYSPTSSSPQSRHEHAVESISSLVFENPALRMAFGRNFLHMQDHRLSLEAPNIAEQLDLVDSLGYIEQHPHSVFHSYEQLAPSFRLAKNGSLLDSSSFSTFHRDAYGIARYKPDTTKILGLINEGATFIFNSIDKAIPSLNSTMRILEHDLDGIVCSLNSYHTPPNAKGFGTHWDDHDVLIIQVSGAKTWRLAANTFPEPHRFTANLVQSSPEKFEQLTLREGEILYIPRGMWHEGMTSSSSSHHLTLGIHLPTVAEALCKEILARIDDLNLRSRVIPASLSNGQLSNSHQFRIALNFLNNEL